MGVNFNVMLSINKFSNLTWVHEIQHIFFFFFLWENVNEIQFSTLGKLLF